MSGMTLIDFLTGNIVQQTNNMPFQHQYITFSKILMYCEISGLLWNITQNQVLNMHLPPKM